jgi:DNA-binding LytR/AlgR family response regulator
MRVHRSHIVNLGNVVRLNREDSTLSMTNGEEVPFSQGLRNELLERMQKC